MLHDTTYVFLFFFPPIRSTIYILFLLVFHFPYSQVFQTFLQSCILKTVISCCFRYETLRIWVSRNWFLQRHPQRRRFVW